MKVAVFGDSFVEDVFQSYSTWFSDFDEYGLGGSDMWYAYNQFLDHHEKYDKVIFACTSTRRVSMYDEEFGWFLFPNPESCKSKRNEHPSYEIMEKYLTHISGMSGARDELFCELLVNRIRHLRPDTLFIKCFPDSPGPDVTPLIAISKIEQGDIQVENFSDTGKPVDIRIAHLTEESHNIIKMEVEKALALEEKWLDLDISMFSNLEIDKQKYFVPIDSPLNHKRSRRNARRS